MGRKKRPAASQVSHEIPPAPPPHLHNATLDANGRPLPPPIPPPPDEEDQHQEQPPSSKRSRNGDDESYLVKKYRADSYYRSIEAFTKYTKAHRMLDASYVRWTAGGETDEKPNVFGIRIAGTFLSWGRGKTRDAAIDASIRAAFALVAAHGYDDFTLTDDCFTEEPVASALAPIPPPPPPPPPGMPPMPPGFAPPAGMPPNFPPPPDMLIPQPAAPKAELAVASGISNAALIGGASTKPITLEMPSAASGGGAAAASSAETSKKKANIKLVFSGEEVDDAGEEMSMEEIRMRVPRYWNMITRAMEKKKSSKDS